MTSNIPKQKEAWNSADTLPPRKGWYRVRSTLDGSIKFRPWGNGHWWTPLPGGWLGRVEPLGLYEWQDGPIRRMEGPQSTMDPLDEMHRAQKIWEAAHV